MKAQSRRMPPGRSLADALDASATISGLLAGHRRAQACFECVRAGLAGGLAGEVRPGPIDDAGVWTLFASHGSAAAKLRQALPDLLARLEGQQPGITGIRVKVVAPQRP
jgi:hypothetical protein